MEKYEVNSGFSHDICKKCGAVIIDDDKLGLQHIRKLGLCADCASAENLVLKIINPGESSMCTMR